MLRRFFRSAFERGSKLGRTVYKVRRWMLHTLRWFGYSLRSLGRSGAMPFLVRLRSLPKRVLLLPVYASRVVARVVLRFKPRHV